MKLNSTSCGKMCKTICFLFFLLFSGIGMSVSAQTTIRGQIIDDGNGETLFGVNVVFKGTKIGASSDFDGMFTLKTDDPLPVTLEISYIGYKTMDYVVQSANQKILIKLIEESTLIEAVEIKGQRISEKQKATPLTVEQLDLIAIKETPSSNFYSGLGSLKGVDMTTASLGFTIINTRGFNSTSPVRSLQIIDGVDNQAPGLNFSLGNFLGSSELDVLKVDLVSGASSAFYGPNAFNGVISMETKNPFYQKGLAVMLKGGERNLFEGAIRWADELKNAEGKPWMAYKINFFAMRADDWEADNYDAVTGTIAPTGNPGRWDAVNIYGDEYSRNMDFTEQLRRPTRGLQLFHRTGYREIDLVDYNSRNYKANAAVHFRTKPAAGDASPEFILSSNYGNGTTVYQGDNRFSLKNIEFFQNRLEFRKRDKFFIRAYMTKDDAGNSYDPYAAALLLQNRAKNNTFWSVDYVNWWQDNIEPRIEAMETYPEDYLVFDPNTGIPQLVINQDSVQMWLVANHDSLTYWHSLAQQYVDSVGGTFNKPFFVPGTDRFNEEFNRIISSTVNDSIPGTKFVDHSALYHVHGEYKFEPSFLDYITVGANARLYTPVSDGTIFYDTAGIRITNLEYGAYTGIQKKFANDKITTNLSARLDKNENFNFLFSPAASVVWKLANLSYLRASFSSAIRNPTLTDQYLSLNIGRATLAGNLNGVENLITIPSLTDYFDAPFLDITKLKYFSINGIRPEKVKTFEIGYRTTVFDNLYIDAGYYLNIYKDFIGYKIGAKGTFDDLGFPSYLQVFRFSANSDSTVRTTGFTMGLNYYFSKFYSLSGNYSWNRLLKVVNDPIVPAFNTPENKFNISISGRDMIINLGERTIKGLGFNINYKWIQGFVFEGSPQFTGAIPAYDLLDAQVNYKIPKWNTTVKLGASNVLNKRQFQTYGGPRIGRLAYLSITYDFVEK
jgi:iron complex outermembrane receptor protein